MRKIGVLLVAVVCVVMMAVPALAYTEVDMTSQPGIVLRDGNTYLETIPVSRKDEKFKAYWTQAMQALSGQQSDYSVIFRYRPTGVYILDIFSPDAVISSDGSTVVVSNYIASIQFMFADNAVTSLDLYEYDTSARIGSNFIFVYWGDFALPNTAKIATFQGNFGIVDDLESSKPTPEPEPEPEPYDPPGPPVPDMAYAVGIPFDTGVFDALLWYLRDGIASVGQVLILGVFLLSVVPLFLSILRRYLVHGNENDDGMI